MRLLRIEPLQQFTRHPGDVPDGQFRAMRVQHLDKAAHVSALVLMRKIDRQRHHRDRVLHLVVTVPDLHRKPQPAHTHPVDWQLPVVAFTLSILQ